MKKILVNKTQWQTRIAIEWDGKLDSAYFASHVQEPLERSYFKGVISKVLPGIQTAFVNIGQERAGFLHISEIDHELALTRLQKDLQIDDDEAPAKPPRTSRHKDIAKILKEGDPILVQVSKEPVYEKGAKLTTCFTLPGRFIVLMPNIPRIGVSKKIEDRTERGRLKDIVRSHLPEGMGGIIRTTSEGRDAKEIAKDLSYLVDAWNSIQSSFNKAEPEARLYDDLDLAQQIVRDHLDQDVEAVIVDNKKEQSAIYSFVKKTAPEFSHIVSLYEGTTPLFSKYGIEKQLDDALRKKVELKSGGSLIIESTEAMTVVDVNTGRFTGKANMEATIFKTNLEAAQEVVRQLKLRNIGGLIVIDFIDMSLHTNKQKLFNFFEKTLKERDKFQSVVLKVSEFGIVQMTRKRSGKSLVQQLTETCKQCHGLGFVPSTQTESYDILRAIKQRFIAEKIHGDITIELPSAAFEYISAKEYDAILDFEKTYSCKIVLSSTKQLNGTNYKLDKK